MVTATEGAGTGEADWAEWRAPVTWPALDLTSLGRPLVVAAHPDDEILGIGGLLALLGGADVVAVTDGEASHPHADARTRRELARARPAEATAALRALDGIFTVMRVRQPDGLIDEEALTGVLVPLLDAGESCLVTWRGDGHPDHEAVGRAAAAACAGTDVTLLQYPVWMWHWAAPGDPAVPWDRAHAVPLTEWALERKRQAAQRFRSQFEAPDGVDPVLPPFVLSRLMAVAEVVFR